MEPTAAIALVVAVVGLCLWGFFRRGSINDRARPGAEAMDARAEQRADDPDGR